MGRVHLLSAFSLALLMAGCGNDDLSQAARELPAALAKAKGLGLPLTAAEVAPKRDVPDSRNAFLALQRYKPGPEQEAWMKQAQDAEGKGEWREVGRLIRQNPQFVREAERIADMDYASARDYDETMNIAFPEMAHIRELVRIVRLQAVARANDQDLEGVVKAQERMRRVAEFLNHDPSIIAVLVQIASEAIRMRTLDDIAEAWSNRPQLLRALADRMQPTLTPNLLNAFRSEFYMGVSFLRNIEPNTDLKKLMDFNSQAEPPKVTVTKRDGLPAGVRNQAYLARHVQAYLAAWPKMQAAKDLRQFEEAVKALDVQPGKGPSYLALEVLTPVFTQVASAGMRSQANGDLVTAKVAALEFRARTKRLPKSLAEIGVNSTDPFTGKPYGYRVEGNGFRIWSVGQDRVDDGGKTRQEAGGLPAGSPQSYDEVVRYPRPRTS